MDAISSPVTDLFGIDLVYGYLFVGVIIGFIVGRITAPKHAPQQVGADSPRRAADAGAVGGSTAIAPGVIERISALVARVEKTEAVKLLREATGFGQTEAQQAIDRLERQLDR
jgi:hypothetical protein